MLSCAVGGAPGPTGSAVEHSMQHLASAIAPCIYFIIIYASSASIPGTDRHVVFKYTVAASVHARQLHCPCHVPTTHVHTNTISSKLSRTRCQIHAGLVHCSLARTLPLGHQWLPIAGDAHIPLQMYPSACMADCLSHSSSRSLSFICTFHVSKNVCGTLSCIM